MTFQLICDQFFKGTGDVKTTVYWLCDGCHKPVQVVRELDRTPEGYAIVREELPASIDPEVAAAHVCEAGK